ncbi:hypothetical protein TanjilG_28101 [Lupinus angustifolius]|uniref:DUF4408 domain-containing protein n=1 Tax=Lupinus angustifolius TaxID=3871 RepID=A0A4P1RH64_LUPAN|nr:PREDICTED: uncharacterized protein LOC109349633 [Lupinus angustifolius]OIW10350.1 hypothetical protein TanjilG_28101 [Lupinus angustifolius]
MEGANANAIHNTKHQKKPTSEKNHEEYPNKFHHHFLFKAAVIAIFLVILPIFPSHAPEFINQTLLTRCWELLHLLLVGIAISYGLFSSRNNETDKEKENNMSKFDNAQILVSRFLHVSSFFEADENSSSESDNESNKVQTWNNQHHRNEPVVVVAPHEDQGGSASAHASSSVRSRIGEKPLLLPVRSLKSRLSNDDDVKDVSESQWPQPQRRLQVNDAKVDNSESSIISSFSLNRSNSKSGSKRFYKGRNDELEGTSDAKAENKMKDNAVLSSPIPWRSRSGRLEPKQEVDTPNQHASKPSMEESEFNKMEPGLVRSQTSLSSRTSPLPSPKFTPSPSFSPESVKEPLAKNAEDSMRKIFYKSCPPPPPPPPPMFQKSISMKPRRGSFNEKANYSSFDKELKRSFSSETKGMKMDRIDSSAEVKSKGYAENMSNIGKSVRKIRADQNQAMFGKQVKVEKDEEQFMEEPARKVVGYDSMEFGEEEKKESFIDRMVMESDDEDTETEDEDVEGRIVQKESMENSKTDETNSGGIDCDEGPDVDKKADEFIAKFREQIRLQRIESIKRSTTKITRNATK